MYTHKTLLPCLFVTLSLGATLVNADPITGDFQGPMAGFMGYRNQPVQTPQTQQPTPRSTLPGAGTGHMGGMAGSVGTPNPNQSMPHQSGFGMTQLRIFSSLDTDGDTNISFEEFMTQSDEHVTYRFDIMDVDGDGFLSPSEQQSAHWGRLDDTDVDLVDLNACLSEHQDPGLMYNMYPQDRDAHFETMDVNGDGLISLEEFTEARTDIMATRFDQIDANADDVISKSELDTMLGNMRDHHSIRQECLQEQQDMNELFFE